MPETSCRCRRDGRHVEHVGRQDQVDVRTLRAARRGHEATRDRGARCPSPPPSWRPRRREPRRSRVPDDITGTSRGDIAQIAASGVALVGTHTPHTVVAGGLVLGEPSGELGGSALPADDENLRRRLALESAHGGAHPRELPLDEQADEAERERGREVEARRVHLERHRDASPGPRTRGTSRRRRVGTPPIRDRRPSGCAPGAPEATPTTRRPEPTPRTAYDVAETAHLRSRQWRRIGRPEQCQARAPARSGRPPRGHGRGVDASRSPCRPVGRQRSGWTDATRPGEAEPPRAHD